MGKIGDLWVRLGLKSDDYKKGMQDAQKETQSFGAGFGKIKASALAVWGAVGAGATAMAKSFINHSQTMGDKWNISVNQMKAVWNQFLTSLTSWDWEGFGDRIKAAMGAATDSTLAHDAEFEVGNSIKLRKAAMSEELAQLQILMRDTQKSYSVRAKAAEDYLKKIEPIYQAEEDLRKRIYLTDTDEYLKNAGLEATADNRELLRKFFTDVAPNESLMGILNEYQKKVQGKKKYNLSQEDYKALDDFYAQYGNKSGAALSVLAQYYQSTNDEVATKVVDAISNYDRSIALFAEETRRVRTLQNSALAQMAKESGVEAVDVPAPVERLDLSLPAVEGLSGMAEVQMPDLITEEWLERQRQMGLEAVEWQANWLETMQNATYMFEDSIVSSVANGMQALTDMMFGVGDMDMGAILAAFLSPFADTLKQMGAMIMAEGIAMEAFKKSFSNPYAAIAAGAALIAIGSAVSSGLQSLTANPTGGSGSSSSYGGNSYGSAEATNYESTLTVYVEGRVSGSDIILAGSNQQNKWNR